MTDTEVELATDFTLQTPFYNKLLINLLISYSTVQEKGWLQTSSLIFLLQIIIQIFSAKRCCEYLGKLLALKIETKCIWKYYMRQNSNE